LFISQPDYDRQRKEGEMPEDNIGGDPQTPPEGGMPEGSEAGNKPDATKLLAELEETRKALKVANAEAADRRKKLQAFEEAEAKRKEAEMSEVEKLNAKLAEMVTEREAIQQALMDTKLDAAISGAAATLKFRNPVDARALIDMDAIEISENGAIKGVEAALKALAKERPYLIDSVSVPDTDGTKRSQGKAAQDEAALQTIAARYGIQTK